MDHPLSYSRARTFDECPLKFKSEYVDGVKKAPESYLVIGSVVHEILDRYVKFLVKWSKPSEFSAMERLAKEVWSEPAHRQNHPESYWDDILDLCVKAREILVFANFPTIMESELLLAVDICGRPCDYESPGARIRGRIDRLEIDDQGNALVTDYKTGHRIESLEGNKQLATYDMLVKAHYGNAFSVLQNSLVYIRQGIVKRGAAEPEAIERIVEWYASIQRGIDWCVKAEMWPAHPGYACRGCSAFRDCPERRRAVRTTPPDNEKEAVEMVERLIIMDREREEVREALRPWVDQHGDLEVNGMVLGNFVTHKLEFDPVKVWTMLQDRGFQPINYMRVDTVGIKKLGRKDRSLAKALEAIARDRSTTGLKLKSAGEDD